MKQQQLENVSPLERMIQQQVVERGIRDEHVLQALRNTPRDLFFPDGLRSDAYADRAAPIGLGQSISQPYIVALMTHHLDVQPNHKILEIGTGSGYQTAILCRLSGEVFSMERLKPLLDAAFERVLSLGFLKVHFRHGDGTLGWPEQAPFDRILIAAGAPAIPAMLLLSHLRDGGIAVLPVGPQDEQMLVQVRRRGDKLESTDICPCRFVKLVGEEGWKSDLHDEE
jgi:protein-L-isoaspartate(D-aspartate) O-methyltransferase